MEWHTFEPPVTFFFFFFLNIIYLFIYLSIYLWLCWVFVSVRGLPPVAASGGHSSSRCAGLSPSRPPLLRSTGSRRAGSVIVAHGPSCSAACGIFPDQGSNPCPPHRQADSQPLRHQGSPPVTFFSINFWLFFLEVSLTCFIVTAILFHSSPGFLSSLVSFLSCFIPLTVSYLLSQQRVKSWHHFSSLENGTLQRTHTGKPAPPSMPIDLSEEIGKAVSVDSLRSFGTSLLSVFLFSKLWGDLRYSLGYY